MRIRMRMLTLSLVFATLAAPDARAQTVPPIPTLKGVNAAGLQVVYVRHSMGYELEGSLLGMDANTLAILVGNNRRDIPWTDVVSIDRRGDSLLNGALVGLGVHTFFWLLTAGLTESPSAGQFAAGAAVYMTIGAVSDALHVGRTRIYTAPRPGRRVSISPLLERDRKGLRFSVVF